MFPALGVGPFLGGVDHLGQISGRRRRRRRSGRISVRRPARLSRGIRLATTGLRSGTYSGEEVEALRVCLSLSPSERRAAAATEKQSEWEDLLYASTSSRREASLNYRCLRKARFLVPSAVE